VLGGVHPPRGARALAGQGLHEQRASLLPLSPYRRALCFLGLPSLPSCLGGMPLHPLLMPQSSSTCLGLSAFSNLLHSISQPQLVRRKTNVKNAQTVVKYLFIKPQKMKEMRRKKHGGIEEKLTNSNEK